MTFEKQELFENDKESRNWQELRNRAIKNSIKISSILEYVFLAAFKARNEKEEKRIRHRMRIRELVSCRGETRLHLSSFRDDLFSDDGAVPFGVKAASSITRRCRRRVRTRSSHAEIESAESFVSFRHANESGAFSRKRKGSFSRKSQAKSGSFFEKESNKNKNRAARFFRESRTRFFRESRKQRIEAEQSGADETVSRRFRDFVLFRSSLFETRIRP